MAKTKNRKKKPKVTSSDNIKSSDQPNPKLNCLCLKCGKRFERESSLKEHTRVSHAENNKTQQNLKRKKQNIESEIKEQNNLNKAVISYLKEVKDDFVIQSFSTFIQPKYQDLLDILDRVKSDIEDILRYAYHNFTVNVYGSATTGLAFRSKYILHNIIYQYHILNYI